MKVKDVVVIGAGPAGITTSIQLKRAGLNPLLLERKAIGGLIANANLVENYPGFPDGICGSELVKLFKKHLAKMGVKIERKEVKNISMADKFLRIITNGGQIFTRSIILATGTKPRKALIRGEAELAGRRLFYEINKLPPLKKQMVLTIIGGGDVAFDYALNLSRKVRRVNIILRKQHPRCLPLLIERVKSNQNIIIYPKTIPSGLEETGKKVVVSCITDGKKINIFCDYVLIAVGREPELEILPARIKRNEKALERLGIYLAGDVKRSECRQVGIAVGDGLLAAMRVINFLKKRRS